MKADPCSHLAQPSRFIKLSPEPRQVLRAAALVSARHPPIRHLSVQLSSFYRSIIISLSPFLKKMSTSFVPVVLRGVLGWSGYSRNICQTN